MSAPEDFVPVAVGTRSGVIENVHFGAAVALDPDGVVIWSVGNPDAEIYGRSANKPLQAQAMIECGWQPTPAELAIGCSSHSGGPQHLEMVRTVLANAGLDEAALQTTPDLPYWEPYAIDWVAAGHDRSSIAHNCSGKHAAMLATCVVNGWDLATYLDSDHPLQKSLSDSIATSAGGLFHVGTDGCGAPTHMTSLRGLARGLGAIARERGPVWEAITNYPELVAGPGRPTTALIEALPGLLAKDGADGVFAGAMPDGTSFAVKVGDSTMKVAAPIFARAIQSAGWLLDADVTDFAPPILGHGQPVGRIEPLV